ncbi:MAG: mechanosensitive ion channel [Alphaproteobacteria bacterium]|nr:mechanosensitive ion channel [Alphaproteobacteria bacterium]
MFDPKYWQALSDQWLARLIDWTTDPAFYVQIGAIIAAVFLAYLIAGQIRKHIPVFRAAPEEGRFQRALSVVYSLRDLLFPLLAVTMLAIAVEACLGLVQSAWLVRIAQSVGVIAVLYTAITRLISHPLVRGACLWIGIPVATLKVFDWLDEAVGFLDGMALEAGNVRVSLYLLVKAAIAGGVLFWLGRISSNAGQKAIRAQQALDVPTRELFAKLFQTILFVVLFVLLLQVLGLDLTALTVFGGALGVGLGFGLQQIASNFISGMILLLERSVSVGDYIELDDGKAGILKELNMRSSTLETFDGKEINVPNETFITSRFVNWTRDDPRQRYEVEFSVSYATDLHIVPPAVEKAVLKHPRVLTEPEEPDCELRGFGDSGVNFAVEFWVDGLDDGPNKFSSDVLFLVWDALKEAGVGMPFPQREVRILGGEAAVLSAKAKSAK